MHGIGFVHKRQIKLTGPWGVLSRRCPIPMAGAAPVGALLLPQLPPAQLPQPQGASGPERTLNAPLPKLRH